MAAVVQMSEYRNARESVDVEAVLRRHESMKARRYLWDSHWKECAELLWPQADEFWWRGRSNQITGGGDKRMQKIFDSTAARSLEIFAAIMESINTPASSIWHDVQADDPELNKDPSVKLFFEQLNQRLFAERSRDTAGYQPNMQEGYKSLGAFGGLPLYVDEHPRGGFRYRYCHVNQLYIETDHVSILDTLHREYSLTAKQALQQWGPRAGENVRKAVAGNDPYKSFTFLHVIEPRAYVDTATFGPEAKPWRSLHINVDEKSLIDEGGYHEMPYMYSRWTVMPSEVYGRSPAMMALPDVKTTQEIMRTYYASGHRATDPPLLLPHSGVMGQGSMAIRNTPGGLNYGGVSDRGEPLVRPLITGMRLDWTETMLNDIRNTTKDWFLVTLFRTILEDTRPGVTATEILQRAQEKGDLIAPSVGRLRTELFGPQVTREIGILFRQGNIPQIPPVLLEARGGYKITYVSEATRLQKSREVMGIRSTLELGLAMAQVQPEVGFVIKGPEALRKVAEYEGVSSELLRTPDEVSELVAQQQKQQQAAQQMAMLQAGAGVAKDTGSAVSSFVDASQQAQGAGTNAA